jgi:hypothetical protein
LGYGWFRQVHNEHPTISGRIDLAALAIIWNLWPQY